MFIVLTEGRKQQIREKVDRIRRWKSKEHREKVINRIETMVEKGINVEREHTIDKDIQKEIAKDHLEEDLQEGIESPNYYDRLESIEPKKEIGPGGHIPDTTGPYGRGMGPGRGRADRSGLGVAELDKKKKPIVQDFS